MTPALVAAAKNIRSVAAKYSALQLQPLVWGSKENATFKESGNYCTLFQLSSFLALFKLRVFVILNIVQIT